MIKMVKNAVRRFVVTDAGMSGRCRLAVPHARDRHGRREAGRPRSAKDTHRAESCVRMENT